MEKAVGTLIVGAGPAGLAVAARLKAAGQPFHLIEQSYEIAHRWHHHYGRLHLHTVKAYSHLPFRPFPDSYPKYVPREMLVAYYEAYAEEFGLVPEFGTALQHIEPIPSGWAAYCSGHKIYHAAHLVLATGVNRIPYTPWFEDQEDFTGRILHSREYHTAAPFAEDDVLVVGMGNTGAEIALDLAEHHIPVTLAVRSPVNIVPREFLGRATQETALKLARLPNAIGDWLGSKVQWLAFGDLSRYGLHKASLAPARQLREAGRTPVIDLGTVAAIKAGKIKVRPGITAFTPNAVLFEDGQEQPFTAVILATGYRAGLDHFLPNYKSGHLNADGLPDSCIGRGPWKGLYFPGFDNYMPGGLLLSICRDSEEIVRQITTN